MPLYEHVFVARQDVSSSQVEALAESFAKVVTDNGGSVTKTESWGLRNLAYRIKKNRKGHYVHFNLDAPVIAISELERNQRINEDIIRYLTIKVEELNAGPSIMMQVKAAREERARREGTGRYDRDRRDRDERETEEPAAAAAPAGDAA
ncbi:30S ribosomal protein S6 [Zavarzinia sp. CC-PAN008]|uniref:30S ribosomal protein S6 n=1 Tax=Zavarzinia sp. CC-PAN008 TaxID=3243332 RepID=UPI003F7464DB